MRKLKKFMSICITLVMVLGCVSFPGLFFDVYAEGQPAISVNSTDERKISFNSDWKFKLANKYNINDTSVVASEQSYDDGLWDTVQLPHDWSIYLDYENSAPSGTGNIAPRDKQGSLAGGVGWYRKTFTVPSDFNGKSISIQFDGIQMISEMWINGQTTNNWKQYLGYVTFDYDITSYLNYDGPNTIAIKVQSSNQSARWYPGAGIYRNVWLIATNKIHIPTNGVYVTTPKDGLTPTYTQYEPITNPTNAKVNISTDVANDNATAQIVSVKSTIYNKAGDVVNITTDNVSIPAKGTYSVNQSVGVPNPKLWSTDSPNLYWVKSEILSGGNVVDTIDTRFGIRYIELNNNTGFYLNGVSMKLNGMCEHSDLGPLGMETYQAAIDRRIRALKDMGCNAIRTAHNPVSPEYIEACDRLGMMLMEEAFDQWDRAKNSQDYSNYFAKSTTDGTTRVFTVSTSSPDVTINRPDLTSNAERDIKAMVDRDKNSPAVIMWSTGNEIDDHKYSYSPNVSKMLSAWVHEIDTTRPTIAVPPWWDNASGQFNNYMTSMAAADIGGFNYATDYYDRGHREYPTQNLIGAETSSSFATRGYYAPEYYGVRTPSNRNTIQMCNEYPGETNFELANKSIVGVRDRNFIMGEFVWTGHDYLGEPTPFGGNVVSSSFGVIDTCGFEKDPFYLYRSNWSDKPTCHLLPQNWNWTQGTQIPIVVYTNGASVEVFLNGVSIGSKTFDKKTANPVYLEFGKIAFAPGELKAVAKDANGKVIATDVVYTADKAQSVDLSADRSFIKNDGRDLVYVEATIVDSAGIMVPDADQLITFNVTGGKIIAVGNGDPRDRAKQRDTNTRNAFHGKALVIVAADKGSTADIVVTATAAVAGNTMGSNIATVKSVANIGDGTVISEADVLQATTGKGIAPVMPTSARIIYDNGLIDQFVISSWDLSQVDINKVGDYTAYGLADGVMGNVECTIHVKDIKPFTDINVTTIAGVAPPLPLFVTIAYEDGEVGATPVTWASVDPSQYASIGTFDVVGTIGTGITTTAHVSVKVITTVSDTTVYTTVKQMPKMPAGVKVKFSDGSEEVIAVEWNIASADYAYPGETVVTGKVLGSGIVAHAVIRTQSMVYLSDLNWASATGTVVKDKTVGGKTLSARGVFGGPAVEYQKGIGTLANSELVYNISGLGYDVFQSYISLGFDNGGLSAPGAVAFEVYLDGILSYESGKMDRQNEAVLVSLPITGVSTVKLVAKAMGTDGPQYDLADWCGAKFLSDNIAVKKVSADKEVYLTTTNKPVTLAPTAKAEIDGVGTRDFEVQWPALTAADFDTTGVKVIYGQLKGTSNGVLAAKVIINYADALSTGDFNAKLGDWRGLETFNFGTAVGSKPNISNIDIGSSLLYAWSENMIIENVQGYGFELGAYPSANSATGNTQYVVFAAPALKSFVLRGVASTATIANSNSFTISVSPNGTDWTDIVATKTIDYNGDDSTWARRLYSSDNLPDNTNYLKVAFPKNSNTWQFNLNQVSLYGGQATDGAELASFKLAGRYGTIDQVSKTVSVVLPYGTNATKLTPEIFVSIGANFSPKGAQDFTKPVIYTVSNGDLSKTYTVNATVDSGTSAVLSAFGVGGKAGTISGTDVTVNVPYGTKLANLSPTFSIPLGASISPTVTTFVDGIAQPFVVMSANKQHQTIYHVTVKTLPPALVRPVASQLVYATTDIEGSAGLPKTLDCKLEDGQTATANVIWNDATYTAYTTVTVNGTAAYNGSTLAVSAKVEVIKPGTIYWVSSASATTGSIYYDAVKTYLGSQLRNTVADKNYAEGSWGVRTGTGSTTAARNISPTAYGSSGYDISKWSAFYGGSNNTAANNYEYVIPNLAPGTYTIAIGNAESWNTATRTMTNSVYRLATPRDNPLWTSATISYGSNAQKTTTGTFTLTENTDVIVRFTAINAQAPCVAWFTISNPDEVNPDTITGLVTPIPRTALYVQDANAACIESKLPTTLAVTTAGGGEATGTVAWDLSNIPSQSKAYDTVAVTGMLTTPAGKTLQVTAKFEVVPRNLVYFIDAGSMYSATDTTRKPIGSEAWNSVKELVPNLLNIDSADKEFSGTWGYTTTVSASGQATNTLPHMHPVINEDPQWYKVPNYTDKENYGWYSRGKETNLSDNATISYDLTLPAGDYMLTMGTKEFWPGTAEIKRPYEISVENASGTVLAQVANTLHTPASSTAPADGVYQTENLFFTLASDGIVTVKMYRPLNLLPPNNEGQQLAWLAVAKQGFYATPSAPTMNGSVLSNSVLLENYMADTKSGNAILATYGNDTRLTAISKDGSFDIASGAVQTVNPSIENAKTGSAKLFIWDDEYNPLTDAFDVPIS